MHELPVTEGILAVVLVAARTHHASRITTIDLVIGELGSIVDDSIQFYFDLLSRGPPRAPCCASGVSRPRLFAMPTASAGRPARHCRARAQPVAVPTSGLRVVRRWPSRVLRWPMKIEVVMQM
jgi:hypothetical protein